MPGAGSRAMSTDCHFESAVPSGMTGGAPLLVNVEMKSVRPPPFSSPVLKTPPVAEGNFRLSSALASGSCSRSSSGMFDRAPPCVSWS